MTAGIWLNGRRPLDWELPAIERGRQCERERDQELLAGLLSAAPAERVYGRPVADLDLLTDIP